MLGTPLEEVLTHQHARVILTPRTERLKSILALLDERALPQL